MYNKVGQYHHTEEIWNSLCSVSDLTLNNYKLDTHLLDS